MAERIIGQPALLSDLHTVSFSSSFVFEIGEIVLVPRTRGGFTYGKVRRASSKELPCYMDKSVSHVYVEYRVVVEEEPETTKGLPSCYVGKLRLGDEPYDEAEDEPEEREVGGRPLEEDLRNMFFGAPKCIPEIGEFVLVPRSKGGFCYGINAKQVNLLCPLSDRPRHDVMSWRATLEPETVKVPLYKDLPCIFVGMLRNPYGGGGGKAPAPAPAPAVAVAAVSSSSSGSRIVIPDKCGECEEAIATLECKNCAEFYCNECSDLVHQKGQRKKHTAIVPVVRAKTQVFTSASTAGQQVIQIGKKKNQAGGGGMDLSSIFAPMPSNNTAYSFGGMNPLFPSADALMATPLATALTSTPSAPIANLSNDEEEKESSGSKVQQKPIFPKRSPVSPRAAGPKTTLGTQNKGSYIGTPAATKVSLDDDEPEPQKASNQKAIFGKPKTAQSALFNPSSKPSSSPSNPPAKASKGAPVKKTPMSKSAAYDPNDPVIIKTGSYILKAPVIVPVSISLDEGEEDEETEETEEEEDDGPIVVPKAPGGNFTDSDDDGLSDIQTLKRPPKTSAAKAPTANYDDDEEDDVAIVTLKKPMSKVSVSEAETMKRPPVAGKNSPDVSDAVTMKRPAAAKPPISEAATMKRPAPKGAAPVADDEEESEYEDEEEEEEEVSNAVTLKRPPNAAKPAASSASKASATSDAATLKRPVVTPVKAFSFDNDDEEEEEGSEYEDDE